MKIKESYETRKEAINVIEKEMDFEKYGKSWGVKGSYHLNHGEYSEPEFKVRKYSDGYGIYVKHNYYPGTYNAPKSGRLSEEQQYEIIR